MKNLKLIAIAILLSHLATHTLPADEPVTKIPLRDFFRNPEKVAFDISDDGQTISFLAPYERRLNLFVQTRGETNTEPKRVTSETDRSIANYIWKGGRLLYLKDFGGDENYHLFSVTRDGEDRKDLTPFEKVRTGLVDRLRESPDEILIAMNKRQREVFDVYRLNVVTGEMRLIAENPGNVTAWLPDHDGKIRVAQTTDGVNTSLLFRETETNNFEKVLTTDFRDRVEPQMFTFDNQAIFAASNISRDKQAIVKMDPHTGKELAVIAQQPDVDMGGLEYSRKRKVLTQAFYTTWKQQCIFFDPQTEAMYRQIKKQLPDYELGGFSVCDTNEDVFIVTAYNDRTRGAEYIYDRAADKLTKLADRSPWLKESEMAEMKPVTYKSRDGLTINGYLTVPKGVEARNLPVVVNPHGGPWYRDGWGFDPEAQFLANRGYAVFQMNYRGSVGYGKQFWQSSFKEWGRKMQDDITDGVQWLIAQGIADPKRVAIYGGSYGGYATLAGLAFTPDLYAAGVDFVGVANLFTFLKTIPPYWKPYLEMWYAMVGDPEKDKELLEAASPVFHADKIKAPLFIAQGANDPRVNKAESDQMVAALKKRDVPVEYMVKNNEGHGFRNEENRFDFYEAMEKFLAEHLLKKKPDAAVTGSGADASHSESPAPN